jgi:hypothetical protein
MIILQANTYAHPASHNESTIMTRAISSSRLNINFSDLFMNISNSEVMTKKIYIICI